MKYKEKLKYFEQHASSCEMAADELAIKLIHQQELFSSISIFQSKCDFNLAWLYNLSPEVILHAKSIHFLADNIERFKRKLTIDEMLTYDIAIRMGEII